MTQKLFDAVGNEVEVPTQEEFDTLKGEREELDKQLTGMEEGNEGLKNLRDAIKRKDDKISDLMKGGGVKEIKDEDKKEEVKEVEKKEEEEEDKPDMSEIARIESQKTYINMEINRDLSALTKDERDVVMKTYKKLSAGEEVTQDNFNNFLTDAKKIALPDGSIPAGVSHGGAPATSKGEHKDFSETKGGKDLGSRLGINFTDKK